MNVVGYPEIFALPFDTKMRLVEELWDSMAEEFEKMPVPDWQMEELQRRRATFLAGARAGKPWGEVERELRQKYDRGGSTS